MKQHAVCVDLGKKRDRAVFFVMKDNPQIVDGDRRFGKPDRLLHLYDVLFIDQFVRKSYPSLVESLCVLMGNKELSQASDLLVDGRNVGEPVVDMMRDKGLYPIPILAGGGEQVHEVYEEMGHVFSNVPTKLKGARVLSQIDVPKQDLVDAGMLLAQQGRVGVARGLHWAEEFKRQLAHFKGVENKRTKHRSYAADDEDVHDDIVFTYLMAAWWFTRGGEAVSPEDRELSGGSEKRSADWNPVEYF